MLDLIDAIVDLLEPPAARVTKIDSAIGAEPFSYEGRPDTLFLFEYGPDVRDLAGAGPLELERFALQAVYVGDSKDEEAQQTRRRDVNEAIDVKRELYAKRIRERRSARTWSHLQAAFDGDYVRAFEVRGFALRISGWRILPLPA